MVKLSDLQIASLLDEIACTMRVDKPIADSMNRLQSRRLGGIAGAAKIISGGLERGQTLAEAMESLDSPSGAQAAAAIRASQSSGDTGLIERLANQLRQRSDFSRESRLSWFYPWLLMAVGYVIAVAIMAPLVRQMNGRDFQWADWTVRLANWLETNWWVPPVVALGLLVVFCFWYFSRDRFPRQVRLALFCNTLADQFQYDVPEDVAISAAASLTGDRELIAISDPSLKSPAVDRILMTSSPFMSELVGANEKQALIARLRYLASIHTERARRHSYVWSRLVPRCVMVLVGAGLTLSYAWWVIAPVYRQVAQW